MTYVHKEQERKALEDYAEEGWVWLGAALHALGVRHVFEIPNWKDNLAKSQAEWDAEKAVAASYLENDPLTERGVPGAASQSAESDAYPTKGSTGTAPRSVRGSGA